MDIKKELDSRGITCAEAADMFGIRQVLMRSYMDGVLEFPPVIRLGIEYSLGYQDGVFVNHNDPERIFELLDSICTVMSIQEASCQRCGCVVQLKHVKTTDGMIWQRAEQGSIWVDGDRYCGTCGPKVFTEMKGKNGDG